MRDRAATYDQPTGERSMGRTVQAFNAILGRQALTESEGWLLLQILKDVRDRQRSAPHRDSLEDGIAYAALKAEARLAEGGAA
jgi:tRNA C32,U32 (ribose-2'-O)-methylase TrmJ